MKPVASLLSGVAFVAVFPVLSNFCTADLRVENHKTGSTVRYPVVLIRGSLDSASGRMSIVNDAAPDGSADVVPVIHDGQFKALVELSEGLNNVELKTADSQSTRLQLTYKPQTNPYYVRLIWMTDNSGETAFATPEDDVPQDYEARLRTAAQLMQTFTAERMFDLGFGRRTFRLERDSGGKIIVHTFRAPEDAEHYYELGDSNHWWRDVYRWLNAKHPDRYAKNIVLAAYTRKDAETGKMKGHTALGGGNLGLFGSASVFSWPRDISTAVEAFSDDTSVDPTRVHDDSAGRSTYWGLASTTIGAALHEMGHTFGLPHCTDPLGIMTRGFDGFNRVFTLVEPPSARNRRPTRYAKDQEARFAPVSASFLRRSRWFRMDRLDNIDNSSPRIEHDRDNNLVSVTASSGVCWVGFWVADRIVAYQEFPADGSSQKVAISMKTISSLLKGKPLSKVTAISTNGRSGRKSIDR